MAVCYDSNKLAISQQAKYYPRFSAECSSHDKGPEHTMYTSCAPCPRRWERGNSQAFN